MQLDWKELSREEVFSKYGRAIDKVIYELPDGTTSDFYIRRQGNSSVVLALTKDRDVILAKQFRPGKGAVLLELPGGGIADGVTPEEAAAHELLEETGYAGKLQFVGESWPDAYCTRKSHVFVATDCEKIAEQKLDVHEFVEVELMSLAKFREHLRSGKLTDVDAGYLGLDFLGLL